MATSTTKVLTSGRLAVWRALRAWQPLASQVVTFWESDDDYKRLLQQQANYSRLPGVALEWQQFSPEWWVNIQQEWSAPLRLSVWVANDRLTLAETLIEDAIDAVYRAEDPTSTAAGPISIIKKETNCDVQRLGPISITPVSVGEDGAHKLLEAAVLIQLRLQKNPLLMPTA